MTYKTASQLQDAFKVHKRTSNERSTLRPHQNNLDTLHQGLRDDERNRNFVAQFAAVNEASRSVPAPPATRIAEAETQTDELRLADVDSSIPVGLPAVVAPLHEIACANPKVKRNGRRCRRCGLVVVDNPETHPREPPPSAVPGQRHSIRFLNNDVSCCVPTDQILPGFPLQPHQTFPKKRKANDDEEV